MNQNRLDKLLLRVHGPFVSAHPAPPNLSRRLTMVLQALGRVIAARAGRDRSVVPLILLLWPYLNRLAARFGSLARRVAAGALRLAPQKPRSAEPPQARSPRLPGGFAWLIRLVPEAAQFCGQVRALLADPEFSALLAAAPRAGKILRPLCRMLGIGPDPDFPQTLFTPPKPPPPNPGPTSPTKNVVADSGGTVPSCPLRRQPNPAPA